MSWILRPGRPEDAPECGRICFEAFKAIADQHNFPPDLPSEEPAIGFLSHVLSRHDVYSIVAVNDGGIVGSNFLWEREGSSIAAVGPVTVDPRTQNSKVGRALMSAVLERARERSFAGVRLVQAAYHLRSFSLYTKLGFDVRESLSCLQGPAIGIQLPHRAVRMATEADVPTCDAVCRRVHGHDRGQELLASVRQGAATVVEFGGRITGYATSIGYVGHAVGESNEDLKALISAAQTFVGPGFLLPSRNGDLLRWCLEKGLHVVQPLTLMSVGLYNEPAGAYLPSILY